MKYLSNNFWFNIGVRNVYNTILRNCQIGVKESNFTNFIGNHVIGHPVTNTEH